MNFHSLPYAIPSVSRYVLICIILQREVFRFTRLLLPPRVHHLVLPPAFRFLTTCLGF